MRIVVVGGTGLVVTKLVNQIWQNGHEAVVAARSAGVDVVTGWALALSVPTAPEMRGYFERVIERPTVRRTLVEEVPGA